jgi:dynactin 1
VGPNIISQKNEDLRLTIEELEQLKEIADELEEHHVESERVLQDEMGALSAKTFCQMLTHFSAHKDVEIADQNRKIDALSEAIKDYDGTIGQYRDLVSGLQR